jgi:hypothetical protein
MFDKISKAAEKAAAGVGRREFLGRLGRGAAVAAGTLGGMLAIPGAASARPCPPGTHRSKCPSGNYVCCPQGTACFAYGYCYSGPPGGGGTGS